MSRALASAVLFAGLALVAGAGCGRKAADDAPGGAPNVTIGADRPILGTQTDGAERTRSADQLRQIGLSWLNYGDANGHFPYPGSRDPKHVSPGLSWRVLILPYIEEDRLFREFRFNEPWDSEHNKKLIPRMPKLYASGGLLREEGKTRYRALAGPDCVLPLVPATGPHPAPRKPTDVADGVASTLAVVEADEPVIWTKPDEVVLGAQRPKLFHWNDGSVLAVFADGEVRTAQGLKLSDDVFRRYATCNGRESLAGMDVWTVVPRRPRTAEEQKEIEEFETRRVALEKRFADKRAAFEADYDKWSTEHTTAVTKLTREKAVARDEAEAARRLIESATRDVETYEASGTRARGDQKLATATIKKLNERIESESAELKKHEAILKAATAGTKTASERADRTKRAVAEAKATVADLTKRSADEKDPAARQLLAKKLRAAEDALKDLTELDGAARAALEDYEKQLAPLIETRGKLLDSIGSFKRQADASTAVLGKLAATEREEESKAQAARTRVAEHDLAYKKHSARVTTISAELKAAEELWAKRQSEFKSRTDALLREIEEAWADPVKK